MTIYRRRLTVLTTLTAIAAFLGTPSESLGAPPVLSPRPNVIFVMFDDLGFQDLGAYGNKFTETPSIDRFAAEGVRLARYYVQSTCSPTRASLLTGRHPQRFNIRRPLPQRTFRGLHSTYPTLAQTLRQNGYATGQFGKWHLGIKKPEHFPSARGFDEHVTLWASSAYDHATVLTQQRGFWAPHVIDDGASLERTAGLTPKAFTDTAIDFIRRHADEPFFVYLPYRAPHLPLDDPTSGTPPERLVDHYTAKCQAAGNPRDCRSQSRWVAAMITFVDEQVGRLLETLDELGLASNTLVFITSDNGAPPRRHLLSNGTLKGDKDNLFEGGIRVPMMVRWPGRIPAGRTTAALATVLDVFPTIAEASGVDVSTLELAGQSFLPALLDPAAELPELPRFWEMKPKPFTRLNDDSTNDYAVRLGDWKLIVGSRLQGNTIDRSTSAVHLFNVAADPDEDHNLALENPLMVDKLQSLYAAWRREVNRIDCPVTETTGGVVFLESDMQFTEPGRVGRSCPESNFHDGNFTFSARVRPSAARTTNAVIAYKGAQQPPWILRLNPSGQVELEVRSQPLPGQSVEIVKLRSTSRLAAGEERRITFTVQGWLNSDNVIRLFVDGELEDEKEAFEGVLTSERPVYFGSFEASHQEPFLGSIRGVHLSTARWTIDEVRKEP